MAAQLEGVLQEDLSKKIKDSKVLLVGAGGIGCEVLKNLVLSGFQNITVIDLDTIDLSNLNRQFLFHREHVGVSKAKIAAESATEFNPDAKVKAIHDSILSTDYGVNFFKEFVLVINALDNRAARNHVNRMCLNADIPLIESGTAGYNGQVELIKKGITPCYECTPKAAQKTFPGCTIRNTPSEPIHCIVWAKHLFNQLFGETDDEEDISPDMADPEAKEEIGNGDKGEDAILSEGNITRISTRQWAKEHNFDAEQLFNKFFYDDINYLLSMSNLWKTRKPPTPVRWETLNKNNDLEENFEKNYHSIWDIYQSAKVFESALEQLKEQFTQLDADDFITWDKDDQPSMDFVAACANIRAHIFNIKLKSRFDIKSMAGNIIPAIATTNAITAGIVVMQTFKVLCEKFSECTAVYVRLRQNARQQILVPEQTLMPPNEKCMVCSADPAVFLRVDTNRLTVKELRDEILIKNINMVEPEVLITAKGSVILSAEREETIENESKTLSEMQIVDGVLLHCDDFLQHFEINLVIVHFDAAHDEPLFEVVADESKLKPKESVKDKEDENNEPKSDAEKDVEDGPSTSKRPRLDEVVNADNEEDDDLILVEEDDDEDEQVEKEIKPKENIKEISNENSSDMDSYESNENIDEVVNLDSDSESEDEKEMYPVKRKASDDNDITEILDSDDEEEAELGPTKNKRACITDNVNNLDEVINID